MPYFILHPSGKQFLVFNVFADLDDTVKHLPASGSITVVQADEQGVFTSEAFSIYRHTVDHAPRRKAIPSPVQGMNIRNLLPIGEKTPTLDEVKAMIDRLERADRANLRPWILAHYNVDGSKHRRLHEPQDAGPA